MPKRTAVTASSSAEKKRGARCRSGRDLGSTRHNQKMYSARGYAVGLWRRPRHSTRRYLRRVAPRPSRGAPVPGSRPLRGPCCGGSRPPLGGLAALGGCFAGAGPLGIACGRTFPCRPYEKSTRAARSGVRFGGVTVVPYLVGWVGCVNCQNGWVETPTQPTILTTFCKISTIPNC